MGLWSWITGVDLAEEQRRSDAADARLKEMNNAAWAAGKLSEEELQARNARVDAGAIDATAQVSDAFGQGLQEGYMNVTGTIKNTIAAPFKFAWAVIPWQVYVAVGLYILWETGWLEKWFRAK
jgi:hypothetical protein